MSDSMKDLSKALNREARLQLSPLAETTGTSNFVTDHLPRIALRAATPYPYKLVEDDSFYPKEDKRAFGRVIRANREEGLAAIHDTISEQENEHGWLFVPEISAWIDVTQKADMATTYTDREMETFLTYMFDDVENVHTHPDHTVRSLSEEEAPWAYSHNYLLEAAQPSGSDMVAYSQMLARTSRQSKLSSSVVSHYGATTVSVRDRDKSTVFMDAEYKLDTRILEASPNPIEDIRSSLAKIAANLVSYDTEEPVFTFEFEALSSNE